ncbi:L-rhamnono-gamma-lactonase [Didymella pomorum]|uniref:L-rhamnono-gamma-lactonase n=1 Tax=Didymella pomorum TaxID=749634 RepID=A0A9W8ZDV1_9PLEO|nr:L-rhamnono-gamma-lactonase [Didymella pomorum]
MPFFSILDSHIHLWPSTAITSTDHGWMTDPSHLLVKRHGISDYKAVAASSPAGSALTGFIYVETDRYLPSKTPDIRPIAGEEEVKKKLREWAKAPLQELEFLRRIVEESPLEGDGFDKGEGERMKGAVVWAPFNSSTPAFKTYLKIAEEVAGPRLWEKIVGFRYLLQGKAEGEVKSLVSSADWVENIIHLGKGRGGRGWAFDVGVDIHRDGTDPLDAVGEMILNVREKEAQIGSGAQPVRFVLNHLCKHALTTDSPTQPTQAWLNAVSKLGQDPDIFMKLSGALNEFEKGTPSSTAEIVKSLNPLTSRVLDAFGDRVMFGSDWPVCNVGGSAGEKSNWGLWVESVESLLEEAHVTEEKRGQIWWKAASKAYNVQL